MGYLALPSKDFKGVFAAGAAVLALCALFTIYVSRGIVDLQRLRAQQAEIEGVAYELTLKNQRMREHLHRLEHDDRYLEKLARERLGWIKPGELVYRTTARSETASLE